MNLDDFDDLGTMLKTRRRDCGLTLDDVANRTRIRKTYLLALEENRFGDLPGDAYISGFLRNYASVLGLPPNAVMDKYRGQTVENPKSEEGKGSAQANYAASPRRKKGVGVLPWLGVFLLVGGAVAVISFKNYLSRPQPLPPREPVAVIDTAPAPPPAPAPEVAEGGAPNASEALPAPNGAAAVPEGAAPLVANPLAPPPPAPVAPKPTPLAAPPALTTTAPPAPVAPPATQAVPPPTPAPAAPAAKAETKSGGAPMPPAAQESAPSVGEKPLVFDFAGNGIVRLESFGANQVEFSGDNRAPQKYDLTSSAVLSWKVRQNARISFADPSAVKIWVDQRPLNVAGRGEIFLQRKAPPAPAE